MKSGDLPTPWLSEGGCLDFFGPSTQEVRPATYFSHLGCQSLRDPPVGRQRGHADPAIRVEHHAAEAGGLGLGRLSWQNLFYSAWCPLKPNREKSFGGCPKEKSVNKVATTPSVVKFHILFGGKC